MSRLFDGVDDESRHGISGDITYGTLVAVVKRAANSWSSIIGFHNAGGTARLGMMFNSANNLTWYDDNALKYTTAISATSTTGWVLCAVTKTTGTTAPRIHMYTFDTTTWQHADNTIGSVADRQTVAGGSARIGQIDNADFFNGRIAVVGAKASVAMSDADIENLITNFNRNYWDNTAGLTFLVDSENAFLTDYGTGGVSQTSLVGTTSDADNPTGWASWAGAAPAENPILVMAPARR